MSRIALIINPPYAIPNARLVYGYIYILWLRTWIIILFSCHPSVQMSMQTRSTIGCCVHNINYVTLLWTTWLQVYHATMSYTDISGGYIVLRSIEPKLSSSIFRGDVYKATAAIETIKHYGTYLFFADGYSASSANPKHFPSPPHSFAPAVIRTWVTSSSELTHIVSRWIGSRCERESLVKRRLEEVEKTSVVIT